MITILKLSTQLRRLIDKKLSDIITESKDYGGYRNFLRNTGSGTETGSLTNTSTLEPGEAIWATPAGEVVPYWPSKPRMDIWELFACRNSNSTGDKLWFPGLVTGSLAVHD